MRSPHFYFSATVKEATLRHLDQSEPYDYKKRHRGSTEESNIMTSMKLGNTIIVVNLLIIYTDSQRIYLSKNITFFRVKLGSLF